MFIGIHRINKTPKGDRRSIMKSKLLRDFVAIALSIVFAGCATTGMKLGGSANTPSASSQEKVATAEQAPEMRKCSRNYGKVIIKEQRIPSGATSPIPFVREAVESTGCFTVIASGAIRDELFGAGTSRQGSSAKYVLVIEPTNAEKNAGSFGAGLGSLLPGVPMLGAIGGGATKRMANVQLTLYKRVGDEAHQVASVQGTASKWDFAGGAGGLGGLGIAAIGGAQNTGPNRMMMNAIFHAMYVLVEKVS